MSKKDLVDAIAKECDMTKEKANTAVDAMLAHIKSTMKKGEEVRLPDFGTFKVTKRAAREGRNPLTGETIKIKAAKVAKFTQGLERAAELKSASAIPGRGWRDALSPQGETWRKQTVKIRVRA